MNQLACSRILRRNKAELFQKRKDILREFSSWSNPILSGAGLCNGLASDDTYLAVLYDRAMDFHLQYAQVHDLLLQAKDITMEDVNYLLQEHHLFFKNFKDTRDYIGTLRQKLNPLNAASTVLNPTESFQDQTIQNPLAAAAYISGVEEGNASFWWDADVPVSSTPPPPIIPPPIPPRPNHGLPPTPRSMELPPAPRSIEFPPTPHSLDFPPTPRSMDAILNNPIMSEPGPPLDSNSVFSHNNPFIDIQNAPVVGRRSTNPFHGERGNPFLIQEGVNPIFQFPGRHDDASYNGRRDETSYHGRRDDTHFEDTKIERLHLPVFAGDIMEFPGWWNRWQATIHSRTTMSKATKLQHLLRKVEGPARTPLLHLPITDDAYDAAIEVLCQRFYKREEIIISHVSNIMVSKIIPDNANAKALRENSDMLGSHIRALKSMNVNFNGDISTVLAPIIYSRLPSDIRKDWANEARGRPMTVGNVLGFFEQAVENRERSEHIRVLYPGTAGESKSTTTPTTSRNVGPRYTTALLNDERKLPPCPACGKDHHPKVCVEMQKLPAWKRLELIREAQRCTKCLGPHQSSKCLKEESCSRCGSIHHPLLCVVKNLNKTNVGGEKASFTKSSIAILASQVKTCQNVLFQTALVRVSCKDVIVMARCLFDLASNHSYATTSLLKRLKATCHGTDIFQLQTFGSEHSDPITRKKFQITLSGRSSPYNTEHSIEVLDSSHICRDIPVITEDKLNKYPHLKGIFLADSEFASNEIDILIGLDYNTRILKDKIIRGPQFDAPLAQESDFGYVVFGRTSDSASPGITPSVCFFNNTKLAEEEQLCEDLSNFFSLESLGIKEEKNKTEKDVLDKFNQSVTYVDGRYEVQLPWRKESTELGDNFKQALGVLKGLQKRFQKAPWLKEEYTSVLGEYERFGFIEKIPPSEYKPENAVFYLPHHPVVKLEKETTKVRPVFNGSQKSPTGLSLNDCLYTGEKLGSELFDILLRFRLKKVAFTSDLKKAFLQVQIHPNDRDVLRFLWINNDGFLETWRFQAVPFGLVSSSFLLAATIRYHLDQQPCSDVVNALRKNLYVDDFDHTEHLVDEAFSVAEGAIKILKDAGMELRQFTTSNQELRHLFEVHNIPQSDATSISKLLGLVWNLEDDTIHVPPVKLQQCMSFTKRSVLSQISKVYDPLGLVSPFVLPSKIFMQQLWTRNLDWDDPLPLDLVDEAKSSLEYLSKIPDVQFPRSSANSFMESSLHLFCDASPEGYGAAAYIKTSEDCNLLCAKSRVAPVKKLTLPRLELLSCLIGTRLLKRIQDQIPEISSVPCFLWCDSQIALSWIANPPDKDIFVGNRVKEIRGNVPLVSLRYVPGDSNPADLLTRQTSASQCLNNIKFWKAGPEWLRGKEWPTLQFSINPEITLITINKENPPDILEIPRHSTLRKLLGVIAYVRRFKFKEYSTPVPSCTELDQALITAIKYVQRREFAEDYSCLESKRPLSKDSILLHLKPTLGQDGIIRSIGRADKSLTPTGLIILHPKSHLTRLIILDTHFKEFHAGVDLTLSSIRHEYWIPKGRQTVKTTIKSCQYCSLFHSKAFNPPESALPDFRVEEAAPFSKVGIDYFGPYNIKDHPEKVYGLIFSCCVTRAIALEVLPDMTSTTLMLAIRRIQARYGEIKLIISDNAKSFRKVAGILVDRLQWRFIPEKSPHWGGFYERLVGVAKNCIKKAVGKHLLTYQEFVTLFTEVEGVVNRRPLSYIGDDPTNPTPLRPIDFLRPSIPAGIPLSSDIPPSASELRHGYNRSRITFASFWNRWKGEYLPLLRKWRKKTGIDNIPPKIGDVVQIHKEGIKNRIFYPIGIIESIIPGRDGHIRAAIVRTPKGTLRRSAHLLYPLESEVNGIVSSQVQEDMNEEDEVLIAPLPIQEVEEDEISNDSHSIQENEAEEDDFPSASTSILEVEAEEDQPPSASFMNQKDEELPIVAKSTTTRRGRQIRRPKRFL